jgi:capsular polysaccharide export protein
LPNSTIYLSLSKPISKLPGLQAAVGGQVQYLNRLARLTTTAPAAGVVAWGKKPSAAIAERYATRHNLPIVRLEDAFLRSVEIGALTQPLGLVTDTQGIYYDAQGTSSLEELINKPLTAKQLERAKKLQQRWQKLRLSKYNFCRDSQLDYGADYVVLVDQTAGDASIRCGMASPASFQQMLSTAKRLYPNHKIVIKTHPDVLAGLKQGHFDPDSFKSDSQVIFEARSIHPPDIIEPAAAVFCVTSQMGFEGLLWGKPVYTFGMPFYAGWGLTTDALAAPSRRQKATLAQLIHAALIDYASYWHPEKQSTCEIEELMQWLANQRHWRHQYPQDLIAERFPRWKREHVKRFLAGSELQFLPRNAELPVDKTVVVWGRTTQSNRLAVEDGFIRSVGLGADLTPPKSWVIDDIGMYYDATRPSRMEQLLNDAELDQTLIERGERLRHRLIREQVSKYNVGNDRWRRPSAVDKVILVPGQVESDASIQFGSPQIKSNLELLRQVQARNKSAYIVYKPHPDVVARLRKADKNGSQISQFCDEIVIHDNMAGLLQKVDEVHTMTSLTGFEALLRGLPVTCYGQPFYSGWGLTQDVWPNERRQRSRSLAELVAIALIHYPRYLSSRSGRLTSVEQALDELAAERVASKNNKVLQRVAVTLKRQLLKIKRF